MKKPKFNGVSVAMPWHKPLCTFCREPIEHIDHAYAGWYDDDNYQSHSPQLVHQGDNGCGYYRRFPNGHLASDYVNDVPVSWLRRATMEAICIAMRRRASTEAERLSWHSWLSAVLGLPFVDGDMAMLASRDGVGLYVAEKVFTAAETARDIGERLKETQKFRSEPVGRPVRFKVVAVYKNDAEREVYTGSLPSNKEPLSVDVSAGDERWSFYVQRTIESGDAHGGEPF